MQENKTKKNHPHHHKALILGTNYYIGLSAIRCLGKKGVHTVAVDYQGANPYGALSHYCKEVLITPHYQDDEDAFVQFLIDYAKKESYKPVLVPCHDAYVEVIDKHIELLKTYFLTVQDERRLLTEVMDKNKLSKLAEAHGVKIPETLESNHPNLLEEVESKIGYPCVVKPSDSPAFVNVFREKLFKVYSPEELLSSIKKANDKGLDVIVQRIIPGFDDHMHTFDVYLNEKSHVTHWTTCQKLRQFPINFGASVYTHHFIEEKLYEIGKPFLESIGYKGFAEIEFKKDAESGLFYLIEINARTTNFNVLLEKLGLNFPYIMYRELTSSPLEPLALKTQQREVFWYAFEDLKAIYGYIKTKQLTVRQVLSSLMRKKTYAIWDWKDPKPCFAFFKQRFLKRFKNESSHR